MKHVAIVAICDPNLDAIVFLAHTNGWRSSIMFQQNIWIIIYSVSGITIEMNKCWIVIDWFCETSYERVSLLRIIPSKTLEYIWTEFMHCGLIRYQKYKEDEERRNKN